MSRSGLAKTTPAPKRYLLELQNLHPGERAWVQGFVVGKSGLKEYLVDDGTAVVSVQLYALGGVETTLDAGSYIMVVGAVFAPSTSDSMYQTTALIAHNLIDLSCDAQRVPLWWLEIAHARV